MRLSQRFLVSLAYMITSLIQVLLGVRIVLKLFGARPAAPFVHWVYSTSEPLLTPFMGMFPSPNLRGSFVIEFSSLFALLIYAFLGYLIVDVIELILGTVRDAAEHESSSKKRSSR